jgi:hypothetical protein
MAKEYLNMPDGDEFFGNAKLFRSWLYMMLC